MRCVEDRQQNIDHAAALVRQAAEQGANVILLPELFETPYFCQQRGLRFLSSGNPGGGKSRRTGPAQTGQRKEGSFAGELFERAGNAFFNTVAIVDADGEILGIYRKTHIPDDHFYQENFISPLETLVFGCGIPLTERLEWASAGISGSRNLPAVWRCWGRKSFSIPQPSVPNPFWNVTVCPTGAAVCRDIRQPT